MESVSGYSPHESCRSIVGALDRPSRVYWKLFRGGQESAQIDTVDVRLADALDARRSASFTAVYISDLDWCTIRSGCETSCRTVRTIFLRARERESVRRGFIRRLSIFPEYRRLEMTLALVVKRRARLPWLFRTHSTVTYVGDCGHDRDAIQTFARRVRRALNLFATLLFSFFRRTPERREN